MTFTTIFTVLTIIASLTRVNCDDLPVFKCTLSGTTCTFNNIKLNVTHFKWAPTSDDPSVVRTLTFSGCTLPVFTKEICEKFPLVTTLNANGQGIQMIEENAFLNCGKLEVLNIHTNQIQKLYKGVFSYTVNMKRIIFYSNQLRTLDDYAIFENMPNLEYIQLGNNNMTEFSPELIRNNKNLKELYLYSNDMVDIEAEKIVQLLPNLTIFELDDNEISCWRVTEIFKMLRSKNISLGSARNHKIRYYALQTVFTSYRCSNDPNWMAASYRKENLKLNQKFVTEERLISNVVEKDSEIEEELSYLNKKFDKLENMFSKILKSLKP